MKITVTKHKIIMYMFKTNKKYNLEKKTVLENKRRNEIKMEGKKGKKVNFHIVSTYFLYTKKLKLFAFIKVNIFTPETCVMVENIQETIPILLER